MTIFVIAEDGTKLMPTSNVKKVRKLLRTRRAVICQYEPFTIKLNYETTKFTQPIEFKQDAGPQAIGISIASKRHEYVSEERILLKDEVEKRKERSNYRKMRRNRKRYRAPRFNNRRTTKKEGWLAPSLRNKKDMHIQTFQMYYKIMPITKAIIETAQFDSRVLKQMRKNKKVSNIDERYYYDTLREAVFFRDNYTCMICKKNAIKNNLILRTHHLGYWRNDLTNKLNNLATVCTNCHTPKNHQPGGKLYGLSSMPKSLKSMAYINTVKQTVASELKISYPDLEIQETFGVDTKRARNDRNIIKSYANDAYCMGSYFPKHRQRTKIYQKRRRNNRVLEKFYDAKIIDIRDGVKKSGNELSCNRTNRSEKRNSVKNERIYRGAKIANGYRSIRKKRYGLRPGDRVIYKHHKYTVHGTHNNGTRVIFKENGKSVSIKKIKTLKHMNGWVQI